MIEVMLIPTLDYTQLLLIGMQYGSLIGGTTILISSAINFGIRLLIKS